MDDSNVLGSDRGDATNGGKSNGMVPSQNDGEATRTSNMSNRIRDLIKALFNIRWNGKHISNVTESLCIIKTNRYQTTRLIKVGRRAFMVSR